jgi:hypothetical protein
MKRHASAIIGILMGLTSAVPAHAQPAGATIGVSYAYLQVMERSGDRLPAGWLFSAAGGGDHIVVPVFEAGGSFEPESGSVLQFYTAQGGARFGLRVTGGTRPFVQILGGVATARCCGDVTILAIVEPGGGVEIALSRRTSLQFAGGVPLVLGEGGSARLLRLRAGVSIHLGKGR